MKERNKYNLIVFLFITGLTIFLFWNFFFKGLAPYPGNYMLSWYEPWKSEHLINQTITLAHKAVADDTFRQLFPFRVLTADLLKQFELPLWNPYNGSGMPLLATMHSGFLNPFNIFFIVFPLHLAWSFHIIMQFLLVCFFTYLYCRSIGMQLASSLFTVSIFALSGFIITRLIFGEYVYVLACLPLLFYLVETFVQNPKTKKIFLLAPTISFMFFSGQPQMILYVFIALFAYAFFRLKKFKFLFFVFFQFLLGVGGASIQLIPTLELYQNSAISTESSKFIFDRFLLPVQHFISIIIPNYFGNQAIYNYWGAGDYIETIAAIGSVPCFFALFYLLSRDKNSHPIKKFYFSAVIVSILLSLNWLGTQMFYGLHIPIISTGIPSRIFIITTFSIAILAGLGFEKLTNEKNSLRDIFFRSFPFLVFIFLIFASTLILFYSNNSCPTNSSNIPCRTVALRNTIIEVSIFIISIGILFFSMIRTKTFNKISQIIIIISVISIGLYNAYKFLPFSTKDTFLPKNELTTYLQQNTLDGRVFGFDEANIKTDFATLFRFYDPNYYDPLYIRRYGELVAYSKDAKILRSDVEVEQSEKISGNFLAKRDKLLNLMSVKYFVYKQPGFTIPDNENVVWQNPTWFIRENKNSLPRTFLVSDYKLISDDKKILEELFSKTFDPKITAIVEEPLQINLDTKEVSSDDSAKIKSYRENKVEIESTTSSDQILVLSDNYYPGWKAYIDDKPVKILRTNYTFRGIELPKGDHKISFIYQPESLLYGIYLSFMSAVIYGACFIMKNYKS